jgi:hypothetical protein
MSLNGAVLAGIVEKAAWEFSLFVSGRGVLTNNIAVK